jgi:hypothetical protein
MVVDNKWLRIWKLQLCLDLSEKIRDYWINKLELNFITLNLILRKEHRYQLIN